MYYITRHPASLMHLNSLPQTSALAAYHAKTRVLAQELTHAWDLPSLLIKPVQRVLRYAPLLHAIIEATPDSHGDKENLRRAKSMVEAFLHAVNEGQRRYEIVREVFAAGKPAELLKRRGLRMVGRVRTGVATPRSISRIDSDENERVTRMGRHISLIDKFIQKFAKETVDWVKSVPTLMSALRVWAEGFGRVIGIGPDVTSEAFNAFLVVVDKQLSALCIDLKILVQDKLIPQLYILHDTIRRPTLLLETLRALEPHHYTLLQHNRAKGRPPPALNEASIAYIALRAQLCNELPGYVSLLHRGVKLCVGQLAKWQARLWRDIRMCWSAFWDVMHVEGEINAGSEETERVWRVRWEKAAMDLQTLNIIHVEMLTPSVKQAHAAASRSPSPPTSTRIGAGSLETAASAPSDTPSVVPSMPHLTVSSRWYRASALYTCRVVHECDPPEGVEYYGLPFFKLYLDDIYDILKEAGPPSQHRDLPLIMDAGEDWLLLARDMQGALGWLIASFMYPVD